MSVTANNRICLIGAGLAGALLATYLARRGLEVDVYENRRDLRREELPAGRSINLALANRGIRALRNVGLYREVARLLIPMRGRMLHESDHSVTLQPYGKSDEEVIYSVSRPGLNALLLDAAERHGASLHFGQRCVDVDPATGRITLEDAASGEQKIVSAAPVIATDGAGSVVRSKLALQADFSEDSQLLEHAYKELSIPANPDGTHRMDANALHVWPRSDYMLIALPNLDGSFTVTLFLAREGEVSFASLATAGDVETFFAREFPDVVPLIPDLAREYFANPTGIMGTVRCKPWRSAGGVLLLGDAAHAVVPFHGQGMNCAFEDCYAFDLCLDAHAQGDWPAVFADFENRRLANANAIADMALENYVVMRAAVRDPRFHLKKQLSWELEKRWPNEFIPRYSMVMFHHIPYAEAQRRGAVQEQILDELLGASETLENIDYANAAELIGRHLDPVDAGLLGAATTVD